MHRLNLHRTKTQHDRNPSITSENETLTRSDTVSTSASNAKTWHRDNFVISTNHDDLQPEAINAAFGSKEVYWTKSLPDEKLKEMLCNSLCLGLYDTAPRAGYSAEWKQIGFRRIITDRVTFAYITENYVLPEYRGRGFGEWLLECTKELLDEMETSMDRSIRGFRVITATNEKNVGHFESKLGMKRIVQGEDDVVYIQRSGSLEPSYHRD